MDKKIFILLSTIIALSLLIFYNLYTISTINQTIVESNLPAIRKIIEDKTFSESSPVASEPEPNFGPPLERAAERVTKKKFGQYITPQNSPVQPEKFRGFHTGTDFEIFPEELNADVPVRAICAGKIALKKTVTGYGGVLVQSCEQDSQPITVVYGHLKLSSIAKKIGGDLAKGEIIGILGKAYSAETSGERKHLHLGIHKGSAVDIRGYVQKESELSGWLDPCSLDSVCK